MFRLYRIMRHRINTDGEGIVSLIGLMGCPLNCKYCINKDILNDKRWSDASAKDVLNTVLQDACYMIATNGGVTFGGGEPLLYYKDIIEFAKLKPDWMNINIETSLQVPQDIVEKLLPYVRCWIVDIKTLDDNIYEKYTKWSSSLMKENLELLSKEAPNRCVIRVPIIPGFKNEEIADAECKVLQEKGFENVDKFTYITRE